MCFAIITAKFGQGEEPQTVRLETESDFQTKLGVLKNNDHCVSISVYKRETTFARKSVWCCDSSAVEGCPPCVMPSKS